jgi:hypothetical protein
MKIMKAVYKIPTAHIIPNEEKMKAFPLRSGARQDCPLSSLLFHVVLKVLDKANRQGKALKHIQIYRE